MCASECELSRGETNSNLCSATHHQLNVCCAPHSLYPCDLNVDAFVVRMSDGAAAAIKFVVIVVVRTWHCCLSHMDRVRLCAGNRIRITPEIGQSVYGWIAVISKRMKAFIQCEKQKHPTHKIIIIIHESDENTKQNKKRMKLNVVWALATGRKVKRMQLSLRCFFFFPKFLLLISLLRAHADLYRRSDNRQTMDWNSNQFAWFDCWSYGAYW